MKKIIAACATSAALLAPVAGHAEEEAAIAPFFIGADYSIGNFKIFGPEGTVVTGGPVNNGQPVPPGTSSFSFDRIKFRPNAARIKFGGRLGENFMIEAAYGRSMGTSREFNQIATGNGNSVNVEQEIEISSQWGIYGRVETGVGIGGLTVNGLIGYTGVRVNFDPNTAVSGNETSDTEDGVSYGFGVGYNISKNFALVADWTNLLDNEDVTYSSANIGVRIGFGLGGGGEDEDDDF